MDFYAFAEDVWALQSTVEEVCATREENIPEDEPDPDPVLTTVKVGDTVYLVESISFDEDIMRVVIEVTPDAGPS